MILRAEPLRSLLNWIAAACLISRAVFGIEARSDFVATSKNEQNSSPAADPVAPLNGETFEAAWRILRDSYYDPTFHGWDWDAVRLELLPKAQTAQSRQTLRAVIQIMLDRLGGSHMAIIPGEVAQSLPNLKNAVDAPEAQALLQPRKVAGDGDVGLEVRWIADQALVTRVDPTGPSGRAGIQPGWVIDAIDDSNLVTLVGSLPLTLKGAQRQFLAWTLIMGKLRGRIDSVAVLQLRNGIDERVSMTLERCGQKGEPVKLGYLPTLFSRLDSQTFRIPNGGLVGLIHFNLWMTPIAHPLDEKVDEFRHAAGIILDLRGNLGGIGGMILGISGHFLNERLSLGSLQMRGNELQFFANPRRVSTSGERVEPFAGPLAILIDGLSLSAAEIFAGGMQALGRARVFGERSGGQALPAVWDRLPNGDVLYHAFGDFVTTGGTRLEGRGVLPDEPIAETRQDLLVGRDAAVLAALEWIAAQKPSGQTK